MVEYEKTEPGERLNDAELAQWLGVSRTPVREALTRLEESGLVQTKPGRYTMVSPLDIQAAKAAQSYERSLFLADEKQLEADLKAKGMEFVEVDKNAFADKGRDAVVANLNPEIKPLYEEIIAAA